jgi:hypothetical protein
MTGVIHYLIQSPANKSEAIYPSDLDTELYYGTGGFFVVGIEDTKPAESYVFHAVIGEQSFPGKITRFRNSNNFYYAEIEGVGVFSFYLRKSVGKLKYAGQDLRLHGHSALYRVWPCNPAQLEFACHKHGFYFTGYSPRLN